MRAGKIVEIGQKALCVLRELAKADGAIVSKSQLMEACWSGVTVEEGNLTVQIAALRKALGNTDDGLEWIVTVPRLGYRLPKRSVILSMGQPHSPPPRSIAVLPFRNLSDNRDNEYFAAGLSAEITSALARYKSLIVHAVNGGSEPEGEDRNRATALGVSFLVAGQAMRHGGKLRVTASLFDGATGAVLWNQRFDAAMADLFAIQDDIAATIASHVEPAISAQEFERVRRKTPVNLSVYELVLRAHHLQLQGGQVNFDEAHALLMKALAQDPNDVLATAQTCNILTFTVSQGMRSLTGEDLKRGEFYARRTIELARGDARVLIQGAAGLLHLSSDAEGALAAAESAYALNPNDWKVAAMGATVQLLSGDIDKAVERYSLAARHGAGGLAARYARTGLAHASIVLGDFVNAIEWANLSMTASTTFPATYWMLVAANAHMQRMDTAKMWLESLMSKWPRATVSSIRTGQPKFKPERIDPVLQGLAKAGMPEG